MIAVRPKSCTTSAISIPNAENVAGPGGMIIVRMAELAGDLGGDEAPAPPKARIEKSFGW